MDFYFNDTSEENIYDDFGMNDSHFNTNSNRTNLNYNFCDIFNGKCVLVWVNRITIGIGLPLTLIVIVAVFSQVKRDQGAPVFVINLLVSDLIQLFCRIPLDLNEHDLVANFIWLYGLTASVGFMVCISCERYMVVAQPLWYRFRRNIKTSGIVCAVVWVLSLLALLFFASSGFRPLTSVFLLPFPLFIFFLIGTIKALSGAISVPADEKRRIVAIQVVVLLIYTLLFLPFIWILLALDFTLIDVANICVYLSPFADTTFYLLIRKSVLDKFLASLCSCKTSNNQDQSSVGHEDTPPTTTRTV